MSLTRALLWAIVACLPVCAIAASESDCTTGPFETDADAITLSFLFEPADSDILKVTEADRDKKPEIDRIHAGVLWHFAGGFLAEGSEGWLAYDAERHLFLSVGMQTRQHAERLAELSGGRPTPPQGDTVRPAAAGATYVVNFARATPDQARQFACLANTVANRYAAWDAARSPLPRQGDPQRGPGGLLQVTVLAYAPLHCGYLVGTDEYIQTFSLRKDGHGFPGLCDATGARLENQLRDLVGSALTEAHRRRSGSLHATAAPANGLGPIIDPYAGRKLDFVH